MEKISLRMRVHILRVEIKFNLLSKIQSDSRDACQYIEVDTIKMLDFMIDVKFFEKMLYWKSNLAIFWINDKKLGRIMDSSCASVGLRVLWIMSYFRLVLVCIRLVPVVWNLFAHWFSLKKKGKFRFLLHMYNRYPNHINTYTPSVA